MSVFKIFILLVFNRECMECNVMPSFRILSSLEFFLCYSQTEWSVFLLFSVNCSQVVMFQIMPALCPRGQWEGGRGWSTKCGQIWTGGGGFPKIPKFVQTSFMDDPLWNLENVVRSVFWIQNSNFSKNLSKSSPISCYFLTYFSLKTQNQISTCHFDLDRVDKIISRAENLSFFPIAFNKVH